VREHAPAGPRLLGRLRAGRRVRRVERLAAGVEAGLALHRLFTDARVAMPSVPGQDAYADAETPRQMTLSGQEFLRRFLLHALPDGFVRIRYYGLFANRHREQKVALCRSLLPGPPLPKPEVESWQARLQRLTGIDPLLCAVCGQPAMRCIEPLEPMPVHGRAPPES